MLNRRTWLVVGLTATVILTAALQFLPWDSGGAEPIPVALKPQINASLFSLDDTEPSFAGNEMLVSQLCTQAQFETPLFAKWRDELKFNPVFHCKNWEWIFIAQALAERGMLSPGKKGLGFGVGQEPLPALFAKHGAEVLATDLDLANATKLGWAQTNQHLSSREILNTRGIASKEDFARLVRVMNVDMTRIPDGLSGFDFVWSTCALGHLGNLQNGLAFIENSLKTLKPGGIAVHTTEFNLSSDERTLESASTSVYRKRDIQALARKLTAQGHEVHVNYNFGKGELDKHIDQPPYSPNKHIKIRLGSYVITPIGLIIRRNPATN